MTICVTSDVFSKIASITIAVAAPPPTLSSKSCPPCGRLQTFETSRPTWVSVQDVVLNKPKDRPRNQVNQSQSSATFTTHTSNRKKCLCSCRYGSCWCVTPWHKTDAESPVDIFLSTSQKRSKTHVVTKSLYIKTWFVCSNKFECLKNVETFQAPKHVLWCLPQIC